MPDIQKRSRVLWKIILYDRFGNPIGPIFQARNRKLTFKMNDVDQLDFSLPLTHPMAASIVPLKTVIKVWRSISIPLDTRGYWNPENPCFCGVVGPMDEEGSNDDFPVTAYAPLWRLQFRFIRELTQIGYLPPPAVLGVDYNLVDQSEIAAELIDYTNAFDFTGISRGDMETTVARGRSYDVRTQIWTSIQEMTGLTNGFDIHPRYVHLSDGDPTLMLFDTVDALGDPLPKVQFHYRVGRKNLTDMTRTFDVSNFCTHVDVDGQGDGTVTSVSIEDSDLIDEYGLYERVEKLDNILDTSQLTDYGNAILDNYSIVQTTFNPVFTPRLGPFFGRDFNMGDSIVLVANYGRMNFSTMQRVYGMELDMDDQNAETCTITLARDSTDTIDSDDQDIDPGYPQDDTSQETDTTDTDTTDTDTDLFSSTGTVDTSDTVDPDDPDTDITDLSGFDADGNPVH